MAWVPISRLQKRVEHVATERRAIALPAVKQHFGHGRVSELAKLAKRGRLQLRRRLRRQEGRQASDVGRPLIDPPAQEPDRPKLLAGGRVGTADRGTRLFEEAGESGDSRLQLGLLPVRQFRQAGAALVQAVEQAGQSRPLPRSEAVAVRRADPLYELAPTSARFRADSPGAQFLSEGGRRRGISSGAKTVSSISSRFFGVSELSTAVRR